MDARIDSWQGLNKSRRKACGECRRLKLRCEKVFPCESCQKRGCAAICPDGSFMKGTRSLKTSALKLHEKMAQMSTRIRDLEDALAVVQASISAEPHPLLLTPADEAPSKTSMSVGSVEVANVPPSDPPDELSTALGTLTVRPFAGSQFHGETASSEYFLHNEVTHFISGTYPRTRLSADLVLLNVLFPFPPSMSSEPITGDRFITYIPEYMAAVSLCETYFTNFSWCSLLVSRTDVDSLLAEVYVDGRYPTNLQQMSLPRLSLLMMVFAIGLLLDTDKPLCSPEAEDFHSLARAALCCEQTFVSTSLECIQAMSLMVWYMRLCPRRTSNYLWAFTGFLSKLVQAIGLHREPAKPLNPTEVVRRQITFWEYISGDIWQSFIVGRPSSMVFAQIDCKKPRDVTLFHKWKYFYTNLVGDVVEQTTGATTIDYRGILELEHKLRDYPVPPELTLPEPGSPGALREVPITLTLQRYVVRLWRHGTLMYLHRRFMAQAIRTHATDIMQSPYAQSIMTAYDSACIQIGDLQQLYAAQPRLTSRLYLYWSHSFSASVVLGALVARSPSFRYARRAMQHLDQACKLFGAAAGQSLQPSNALELMTNIQRKARFALEQHENYDPLATPETTEKFVTLGIPRHGLESQSKLGRGSPSSPPSLSRSMEDIGSSHSAPGGLMTSSNQRGLPTPTSPTDLYSSSAHRSAGWPRQQQAYFPSRLGSEGREISDTLPLPARQTEFIAMVDQGLWPQTFINDVGL